MYGLSYALYGEFPLYLFPIPYATIKAVMRCGAR